MVIKIENNNVYFYKLMLTIVIFLILILNKTSLQNS